MATNTERNLKLAQRRIEDARDFIGQLLPEESGSDAHETLLQVMLNLSFACGVLGASLALHARHTTKGPTDAD